MQNEIAESRSQVRTLKRIVCLACSFGSVLLLNGCSWMYTELEQEDMRHAEIRARGIELENMQREEDDPFSFDEPVNPQNPVMPGDVEPELE